jgi:hypothetical protein
MSRNRSRSHIATDDQSVGKSWPDIYFYLTITVLLLWGALFDERTGLSFVYAAGPCQRSLSRVRVPWDSRPYFTVSDLRLTFSSPPTTPRVTVEVFDPASTREWPAWSSHYIASEQTQQKTSPPTIRLLLLWRLPSNNLDIVDMFIGRYQGTLLAILAQQQYYTFQYILPS